MKPFVKIRIYPEITLEMLERVFRIDKVKAELAETTKENDRNELQSQIDKAHTYLNPIVSILNEIKDGEPAYVKYHLDTEERLAHFFAQCYHEVGGVEFKVKEDLNYQIKALFDKKGHIFRQKSRQKFPYFSDAFKYGLIKGEVDKIYRLLEKQLAMLGGLPETSNDFLIDSVTGLRDKVREIVQKRIGENKTQANEEEIANLIYADSNRSPDSKLGNDSQGDGWKYRGRGMIQLTGRGNYQKFSRWAFVNGITNDLLYFIEEPDKIAEDPKFAFLSAVYFWNAKSIYLKATSNDGAVKAVTKKVNGGDNGLLDRAIAYYRIKDPYFTQEVLMHQAKSLRRARNETDSEFAKRQVEEIRAMVETHQRQNPAKGIFEDFKIF